MEILTEKFILYALAAGVMIGSLCAFLGVFVMLKRIVFLGITLAEVSALGVAAGLIIGIDPMLSALVLTVGAVFLFWLPYRSTSISREGLIGFTYVSAAALAVILIAKNPMAESKGLDLVSGNLLYVGPADLAVAGILTLAVAVLYALMYRNFLFVSFDPETARASGINAGLYDFLIYLSIGVTAGVTMKMAGVLFVFGSLVIPPLAGLLLFRRMPHIIAASVVFSIVCSIAGIVISVLFDWPTAPSILVTDCALLIVIAALKMLLGGRPARG
jgi:ABC-type Mn2+/Zn2+ transport system permease subunit